MRQIRNIIFILVLLMTSLVMPINTALLKLDLSKPIVDVEQSDTEIYYTYTPPVPSRSLTTRLLFKKERTDSANAVTPEDCKIVLDNHLQFPLSSFETLQDGSVLVDSAKLGQFGQIKLDYYVGDQLTHTYYLEHQPSSAVLLPLYEAPEGMSTFTLFLPTRDYAQLIPLTKTRAKFRREYHWVELYNEFTAGLPDFAPAPLLPERNYLQIQTQQRTLLATYSADQMSRYSDEQLSVILKGLVNTFSSFHYKPAIRLKISGRENTFPPYDKYEPETVFYEAREVHTGSFKNTLLYPVPLEEEPFDGAPTDYFDGESEETGVREAANRITTRLLSNLLPSFVEITLSLQGDTLHVDTRHSLEEASLRELMDSSSDESDLSNPQTRLALIKAQIALSYSSIPGISHVILNGEELSPPLYINSLPQTGETLP